MLSEGTVFPNMETALLSILVYVHHITDINVFTHHLKPIFLREHIPANFPFCQRFCPSHKWCSTDDCILLFCIALCCNCIVTSGTISSGNAWEWCSECYFDSGNGFPQKALSLHQNSPI